MKTKILIPLFVVALSVLPLFLYLNNCRFMQRFYWRMVFLHNARRLYTLLLVLVLLVINATLYVSMNVIISLLMMTVVLALSSYRTMAKTLRLLQYRRRIFGLLTVAAAALIVVPGCLCIGLTLASLLLGAFFFPSARVLELSETEEYGARMLLQPDIIVREYYFI